MNGLLKSKTDYLTPNGLESIVKKTEFEYETKESTIIKGYMIQGGLYQNTLDLLPYDILSSWIVNKKIIEKDFDINNLFAEKSTNFSFDANNKQKIAEDYLDSKGDTYSTKYLYPKDLVTQGNTNPYQDMELRNMSGIVIQIEKYKNSTLLNKTYNDYAKSWISNPDLILPKAVRTQYKSNNPENRIIYNSYDPRGNVTNVSYEKGPPTSYKWGYIEQYPIAEIKNSAVNEFYSQNFEEPELGLDFEANVVTDDAQVHTGKYSGRIINPNSTEFVSHSSKRLNISLTAPKKFTFSGWVFSNGPSVQLFLFMMKAGETGYNSYYDHMQTTTTNKWVYMKKEFLVPADVVQMFLRLDNNAAGTVWFDDLRIQPSDASMSTYTYEPLVGMTSAIDDSGKTVYYEYDDFKRLMNIKDQNGFIIKNYDYHYKP